MKPHIRRYYGRLGVLKWRCASTEAGSWGPYVREGVGYTPLEAYQHWQRYGHHGRRT